MPGGLMNLNATGNENIILNGNPKKTFFKATYNKFTNFGMQKFRIDYEGQRKLNISNPTVLDFKIPRYADLLYETFICVTIPDIWSPLLYLDSHDADGNFKTNGGDIRGKDGNAVLPYEFKWIKELGAFMVREIEIHSGGVCLSKYSGEYLSCLKERDFNKTKKELWNKMVGNTTALHSPEDDIGRENIYPHAQSDPSDNSVEPSIKGRKIYIPLDAFFCDSSKLALPLVALQYQEIFIRITFEPIKNLYVINDTTLVEYSHGLGPRISPNPNEPEHQLWRFLQPPQKNTACRSTISESEENGYDTKRNDWNADIHLISTYIFLDKEEQRVMAQNSHNILFKQIHSHNFFNIAGSHIIQIESKDLVANYMWRFRRSDAKDRNEWQNYTNLKYDNIPGKFLEAFDIEKMENYNIDTSYPKGWQNSYITGNTDTNNPNINNKNILSDMGIILGGVYRENILDSGVYNYIEKYNKTTGNAKDGLYCYSFGLNNNRKEYQPSGSMNLNRFKTLDFEFNTLVPNFSEEGTIEEYICDSSGNPISFRKNTANLYDFTYDLIIFEERYNVLMIQSGRCGLLHAT
jgi:hypothetical protein